MKSFLDDVAGRYGINFSRSLEASLQWEGGLSDHPLDSGGITNLGISLNFIMNANLDLNEDGVVDAHDIIGITNQQAAAIYHKYFWEACHCDEIAFSLACLLFDFAINSGPHRSITTLQRLVKTKQDGYIGPKTLEAISTYPGHLSLDFASARIIYLSKLKNFNVFGYGWVRRVLDVYFESQLTD